MKYLVFIFLFIFSFNAISQTKEDRKLLRQQRKEQKKQKESSKAELVEAMIHAQKYVLEADRIRDRRGRSYMVQSMLNFISVDSNKAVMQLGDPTGLGYNGVGGITVNGDITDYNIDYREKSGSYTVTVDISSTIGFFNVVLFISSTGKADARVTGATSSGSLTYVGDIVPLSKSTVYKGSAI